MGSPYGDPVRQSASEICAVAWLQGCTNNLTFGDPNLGYYETIGGGAGAGPGWHGRSGVHTHMTNTRITDPEILERRYPVGVHLRPGKHAVNRRTFWCFDNC
jgi:N-methylhydantoinase B/oxoprolinase/acetone carboxylase alpha subunit